MNVKAKIVLGTPDAPILPTNRNNSDISAPESLRGLLEKGAAHDFAPNQTFQDLVNKEFRPIESGPSIPFSSNYGPSLPLTTTLPYHHIDPSTVPVDHLSNSLTNPADLDHTLKTGLIEILGKFNRILRKFMLHSLFISKIQKIILDGHNDCGNCGDWEIDNPEKVKKINVYLIFRNPEICDILLGILFCNDKSFYAGKLLLYKILMLPQLENIVECRTRLQIITSTLYLMHVRYVHAIRTSVDPNWEYT